MFEAEKELYTDQYFRKENAESNDASAAIVPIVLENVKVSSVLDVGCGVGAFLRRFRNHGVTDIQGVDGDYVPDWIKKVPSDYFYIHDLKQPLRLGRRFDLVVCLEVAEHLPESAAPTLIDSICRHGDTVMFSAAVPGQGGVCHVNEQPHEYWQSKFMDRGYFRRDLFRPLLAGTEIAPWYKRNTFLYVNESGMRRMVK